MKAGGLVDSAVMGVPGLAFLVGGLVLPDPLATLCAGVLAVVIAAIIGWVLAHRADIEAWPPSRLGRRILWTAALGIVLMVVYFFAYSTVVTEYDWSGGEAATKIFVPATLGDDGLRFPFVDCRLDYPPPCEAGDGTPGAELSADGVAALMSDSGPDSIRIPRGAVWYGWAALLVAVYAGAAALLISLFGFLRIRRLDVAAFLGGSATEPAGTEGAGA